MSFSVGVGSVTCALSDIHLGLLFVEGQIWSPWHDHKLGGIRRYLQAWIELTPVEDPVKDFKQTQRKGANL
jgi:hypothetical protein